jgi:hypothetical protein
MAKPARCASITTSSSAEGTRHIVRYVARAPDGVRNRPTSPSWATTATGTAATAAADDLSEVSL